MTAKSNGLFRSVHFIEEVLAPFHKASFVIVLLATHCVQAAIMELLIPVKNVFVCFLITFPFTMGLIIIFLVLYNLNWAKLTGASVIVGLSLFTLLFYLLMFISDKLDLKKIAEGLEEKEKGSKVTAIYDPSKKVNIAKNLDSLAKDFGNININPPTPWYGKLPVISPLIGVLANFYIVLHPAGFFSAIAIALIFASYIQTMGKKYFWRQRAREAKEKDEEVGS